MIWAVLALIGVPLWLIALAIIILIRVRSRVRSIPGSVRCKVRSASPGLPRIRARFARTSNSAYWVHDVLIVHTGAFLTRCVPIGIVELGSLPRPWEGRSRLRPFESPVAIHLQSDSGAVIEVVCAESDAHSLLGAFARQVPQRS
jgi:hypothetical protein